MNNQNLQLNIGDKIGFVILAGSVDSSDQTVFFPVAQITERDGERAYLVEFPDGELSKAAIRQSDLASRPVQIEARVSPRMICLSERRAEFTEALNRGKNNRFDVFADWDKDAFVVVNLDNRNEYRVKLETFKTKLYAECSCPDFSFKKRICKHIGEVLMNALFTTTI